MNLHSLVRCPSCNHGPLAADAPGTARCAHCQATFPTDKGFVDLLPPATEKPGYAQRTMLWPPLIRMYEGPYWRRSFWAEWIIGLRFDDELALIVRTLGVAPGHRVLDLACGPGIFTRPFARAVQDGVVVGLDISEPMLSYSTMRARQDAIDNIVWVRASAMDIPLADASLDGANCCGALHLFPDLPKVLAEVFRILKPGGRFTYGTSRRWEGRVGDILQKSWEWSGLTARKPETIRAEAVAAGFVDFTVHHDRHMWQIGSMKKPG
jgi:SAM-dependent methyltransferase